MKRIVLSDKVLWAVNLLLVLLFLFWGIQGIAQDTVPKGPKHYFNSTFWFNWYGSNHYKLTNPKIDTLGEYSFTQSNLSFFIPLATKDIPKKDGKVIANRHLLLTGSFLNANPNFSALGEQHTLFKSSLGLRYIYNNGEKNIWFFDIAPFVTGDNTLKTGREMRTASVLVFNRTVSARFSFKVGFTKTFLFGDRLHLPILGIRIGRLDGIYASLTFPRNISVNFPIGKTFSGSVFLKPMGGIYNFANSIKMADGSDTIIYAGFSADSNYVIFGRFEYLGGFRLDYTPSRYVSLFLSAGFTSYNWLGFASYQENTDRLKRIKPFVSQHFDENNGFLNFGLVIRLGKTRKIAGNTQMYEVLHLNNTFDPGDNNTESGDGNIPKKRREKDLKRLSYKDIEDFVEESDL